MAWLTREESNTFSTRPHEPDMETLTYWVKRMEPLIRSESGDEVILIFANRTGIEDDAVYAGTSAVLGIQHGEVTVYGVLGRGEKKLLVVDTSKPGFAKMVYRPDDEAQGSVDDNNGSLPSIPDDVDTDTDAPELNSSKVDDTNSPPSGTSGANGPSDEVADAVSGTVRQPVDSIDQQTVPSFNPELENSLVTSWLSSQPLQNDVVVQSPLHGVERSGFFAQSHYEAHKVPEELLDNADYKIDDSLTDADSEPVTEFSSLVKSFKKPDLVKDESTTRPLPTISRGASRSRNGAPSNHERTGRAHSRPRTHHRNQSHRSVNEQYTGAASSGKTRSRINQPAEADDSVNRVTISRGRASPDLAKIGADMMVFEEGTSSHPKRDSLLCHVDDDDYVVLQTVRKDGHSSGHKKSASEKSSSRPCSNPPSHQTSRRHGSTSREHSRSHARRTGIADSHASSPRASEYREVHSESRSRQRADSGHYTSSPRGIREMPPLSNLPSAATTPRSRQEAIRNLRADIQSHSPTRIVEHQAVVPVQHSKYRKDGSQRALKERSKSPVPFSPKDMADSNPSIFSPPITCPETPDTGITDLEPRRSRGFPLTPRAMVLPDDSSSEKPKSDSSMTRVALPSCM